jgi:hypothetical protein
MVITLISGMSATPNLRGLALISLAAVLFSRAGYGPSGDPAQRAKPCTMSRCAHNAT